MMVLKDNSKYSSTVDNLEAYLSLQSIANRQISDLLGDDGNNLLIYPHSFCQCDDEAGKQPLLSLQPLWKDRQCTKVILETGNMAGFIGVNGQTVSIHSRFSEDADEDFFLHYMLSKVLCLNVVNLPHGTTDESVFNFLLYLFPKFLNDALAQGVYKEYQRHEYNDANVRGTIDVNRHLKTNMPFNGRVAYRTREFSHDNHVTQLIRHTIDYINQSKQGKVLLEKDAETRSNVAQVISATPLYKKQDREKVMKSNSRIMSHPYYSNYTPLQKLCLRILRHERIKYGAKGNSIYGLLFDVSYLWEEYLATILTKQGFKHPNNKKSIGRIYLARHGVYPRYPDFYREQDNTIIDAKYKKESTRDDVHQMIAYMYRLKGKCGVFIQPSDIDKNSISYLLGHGEDNNAELQTYLYPISRIKSGYKEFVADMVESEEFLRARFLLNK